MNKIAIFAALFALVVSFPAHAQRSFDGRGSVGDPGGSIIPGYDSSTCDGTIEGALRYNSSGPYHEFCDGTSWRQIIGAAGSGDPPTPPAGTGYFVVTNGTWNGNLGGLSGANSKCLTDLTNNDWLGKGSANVDSSHVFAFLCDNNACNNLTVNTTYTFAVSGDNTKGGATFVTNSSGQGPGNTQNWSGTNYFDGLKTYWTNRESGSSSLWSLQLSRRLSRPAKRPKSRRERLRANWSGRSTWTS